MTPSTDRYPVRTRILHWLTAILIFTTLLVGFVMVNSIGSYASLVVTHMTLGMFVLSDRRRAGRESLHPSRAQVAGHRRLRAEHLLVIGSELALYAMMLAQPLIGWAMVSASGGHVMIFGSVRLPRIAPFDADLYFVLRQPTR